MSALTRSRETTLATASTIILLGYVLLFGWQNDSPALYVFITILVFGLGFLYNWQYLAISMKAHKSRYIVEAIISSLIYTNIILAVFSIVNPNETYVGLAQIFGVLSLLVFVILVAYVIIGNYVLKQFIRNNQAKLDELESQAVEA